MENRYRLGLALSGGGIKGFAHAGALKALQEHDIHPDIIAGTSAGSIVAALYAAGYDPEGICAIFRSKGYNRFVDPVLPVSGMFKPNKFIKFLKESIPYENLEDLPVPIRVVATDLDHGKSVVFSEGSISERVMASSTIPLIFVPTRIDGVNYIDGGIFRNFPVSTIRKECEKVIGINVSPLVPTSYKMNVIDIADRTYNFMFRANTMQDRKLCDVLIEMPEALQYGNLDLPKLEEIYQLGYEITNKQLEEQLDRLK